MHKEMTDWLMYRRLKKKSAFRDLRLMYQKLNHEDTHLVDNKNIFDF